MVPQQQTQHACSIRPQHGLPQEACPAPRSNHVSNVRLGQRGDQLESFRRSLRIDGADIWARGKLCGRGLAVLLNQRHVGKEVQGAHCGRPQWQHLPTGVFRLERIDFGQPVTGFDGLEGDLGSSQASQDSLPGDGEGVHDVVDELRSDITKHDVNTVRQRGRALRGGTAHMVFAARSTGSHDGSCSVSSTAFMAWSRCHIPRQAAADTRCSAPYGSTKATPLFRSSIRSVCLHTTALPGRRRLVPTRDRRWSSPRDIFSPSPISIASTQYSTR